jgi:hypothetical protein
MLKCSLRASAPPNSVFHPAMSPSFTSNWTNRQTPWVPHRAIKQPAHAHTRPISAIRHRRSCMLVYDSKKNWSEHILNTLIAATTVKDLKLGAINGRLRALISHVQAIALAKFANRSIRKVIIQLSLRQNSFLMVARFKSKPRTCGSEI